MRTYEALYIVTPELDDDAIQTIAKEVEALVVKHGGAVVRSEIWGKRKLAYDVKKHSEGCYVLLRFTANADFVARLEGHFKLSEQIIRYLVVYFDEHTLRLESEQEHRREEDLRAGAAARGRDKHEDEDEDEDEPVPVGARRRRRRYGDDEEEEEEDEE